MLTLLVAAAAQTVFGIALGEPLQMPECGRDEFRSYKRPETAACRSYTNQRPDERWSRQTIQFPIASSPAIARSGMANVFLQNGVVVGVEFDTFGVEDQDAVLSDLTGKYGKPAQLERMPGQTRSGAAVNTIAADWRVPGAYVSFFSAPFRIDLGRVTVLASAAKAQSDVDAQAARAKRTPL